MPRPKDGYKLKDGRSVPGVTTITGQLDDGKSDALVGWAIREMKAGRNPRERNQSAKDVGDASHALIEAVLLSKPGDVVDLDAVLIPFERPLHGPALMCLANFNEWAEEKQIKVRSVEEPMVSETWRVGTTPDLVIETKRGLALCDWKSGGAFETSWIEMEARRVIWNELRPDEPLNGGFHILQLNKSACAFSHHYHKELPGAWDIFVNLLDTYNLLKEFKSHLKGKLD